MANEPAVREQTALQQRPLNVPRIWTEEEKNVWWQTLAAECKTDAERALYLMNCEARGLDPRKRELYAIRYKGALAFQVSIHALIRKAHESRIFVGFTESELTVRDRKTHEMRGIPASQYYSAGGDEIVSLRIGILLTTRSEPFYTTVHFLEYSQDNARWNKAGFQMLEKCGKTKLMRDYIPGMEDDYCMEDGDMLRTVGVVDVAPEQQPPPVFPQQQVPAETQEMPEEIEHTQPNSLATDLWNTMVDFFTAQGVSPDGMSFLVTRTEDKYGCHPTCIGDDLEDFRAWAKSEGISLLKAEGYWPQRQREPGDED